MQPGVCLDGRNLWLQHGTGITTYTRTLSTWLNLLGRTPEILVDTPVIESRGRRWMRAARPGPCLASPVCAPTGFGRAWSVPDVFRIAQIHVDVHRQLLRLEAPDPPAIMHWTSPLPLAWNGTANVYTIHDLIPLTHPMLTGTGARRFGRILRLVAHGADHVVTVSETSRDTIIELLGLPPERVTNTYQPVELPPVGPGPPGRTGHFLFCGTIEPRKNVRRLVAAHAASGTAAPLILAGPDGWRAAAELDGTGVRPLEAMPAGAAGGVWRAPFLPRDELVALMRGARAVLFPSLAEGFGLPIAEAMALGVPVMTSSGGATGEVAGGAALLVDPLDVRGMAGAIAALDRDAGLCERLAAAGLRRAVRFSPEACLARLAPVYDRVGAARPMTTPG